MPKEPESLEQILERSRFIRYSQERWNEMRDRVESGESLIPPPPPPAPEAQRKPLPAQPPPLGPGINVVLPYESGLSISGRKVIDFKLDSTLYSQPDLGKGRVNATNFTLDQQLQVRVKGTVGRKVTVNVDYDDTREDKRDVSVEYKGDPDEVLQDAAFGDITISLPSTQFVGYSKSVFGARAELQFRPRSGFAQLFPSQLWHRHLPNKIKTYLIGSQTKGVTQTKRFSGTSELKRANGGDGIADINYVKRTFYQLAFATGPGTAFPQEHRPIAVDSERIFLYDQNPTPPSNAFQMSFTIFESTLTDTGGVNPSTATFSSPAGANAGFFFQLVRGVDYNVDYAKGVVRFLRTVQPRDVIVVDYTPVGQQKPLSQLLPNNQDSLQPAGSPMGGFKPILLKPDESLFFATRELKNYYSVGDRNLVHDDGRGNFILKVLDLARNEPSSIVTEISTDVVKPVPKYPKDMDVDFENGIISFVSSDSLHTFNPKPFPDDIYNFGPGAQVPTSKHRYNLFVEYRTRKGSFNLEQTNIVSQSEQVYVDGRKMTRDVDYFIDYDLGQVTFFRPEQIHDDSIVEITYDFSPFGGHGEETVVGMRNEIYFTDDFFVGGSVLYNFTGKTRGAPDLRSVSHSITVLESDVNWKNIKFGSFPLQITNFSAEYAKSIKNPNTADKALIESFEGVKLEDSANLNKDSWQVSATPQTGNPGNGGGAFPRAAATALALTNEDVRITDVNPGAPVETSDRLQALDLAYSFPSTTNYAAASVVQVLSNTGLDFFSNKRQFLEVWVFGDNSGQQLNFRLGGVAEDADGQNGNGAGVPKTEDVDNNNVLGPGEDTGWNYVNPDGSTTTIGAGNGRLDSEDLNRNRILDADDTKGNYLAESSVTVNFSGWKIVPIPLNIPSTDQGQSDWSAIKDMRITVVSPPGTSRAGSIKIGHMAVTGTRFTDPIVDPSTGTISSVSAFAENNEDNPGYVSLVNDPTYQDLYDVQDPSKKRREQALALQFQRNQTLPQDETVTTKETFSAPLDLSEHERLKFFVFSPGVDPSVTVIFRIGTPGNYFEFQMPLTWANWRLFNLDIKDGNRDGFPDTGHVDPLLKRRVGTPSLRNISEITMGVLLSSGSAADVNPIKIDFNEIHVTGAVKQVGEASRAGAQFAWPGWATWGIATQHVDPKFQTLTSVGTGQDQRSVNGNLNFTRLRFLPITSNMSWSQVVTPQIQTLDDPNILVPSIAEGKVQTYAQSLGANLLLTQLPFFSPRLRNALPNLDGNIDHSLAVNRSDVQLPDGSALSQINRQDETTNYRFGSSYALPWQPDILPGRYLTFKPLPQNVSFNYSETNSSQKLPLENTDTTSIARSYSLRSTFQFFPQLNLTPSYSLSRSFEDRQLMVDTAAVTPSTADVRNTVGHFEKNLTQAVSLAGSLRLFAWLNPGFSYSINTNEDYNVNDVSFGSNTFRRGELKTINRHSNADVSASLAPKDVFQYVPYLRLINPMINSLSFSGGYTLADGDSYENVTPGFYTRDKLFIRGTPLNVTEGSPDDQRRTNLARLTDLTATDSTRLQGRWTPFEGFTFLRSRLWAPLRNLNTSGTFTETKTDHNATGTQTFSYSKVFPDFIFSTTEIERPLFLSRWVTDTRLNGNYQERLTEVSGQTRNTGHNLGSDLTFTLFKLFQFSTGFTDSLSQDEDLRVNQVTNRTTSQGFNAQVITTLKWGNWRLTPRYDQNHTQSVDGTGKATADSTARNATLQIFGDMNIPRFFRLPFGKQLTLSNRLILTSSLHYGMTRNEIDATQSKDVADANLTGDFEITPNIRAAFGGGFSRTMNKVAKEQDFTTISLNSRVTIQF